MKKLIPLIFLLFILGACGFSPSASDDAEGRTLGTAAHECTFYEPERLAEFTERAEKDPELAGMRAAIVPHYAPKLGMLSNILASITYTPETFVIVAPDHPAAGDITISPSDWYWSDDIVSCDTSLAEKIAENCTLTVSDELDDEEWSASTLLPYIHGYFPDAKVVIIYASRAASPEKLAEIAKNLAELPEDEIFLLGSVDFSHYQDEETAVKNDKYTRSVIENMDTGTLLNLGNEYLDSPQSASVIIKYAAALGLDISLYDSAVDVFFENGERLAGTYQCYAVK